MGRRKKEESNGTAENGVQITHVETNEPVQEAPSEHNGSRPCKSFSIAAGSGVYIESSVWPRQISIDEREVTVYSATVRKNYRKEDKTWGHTGFFRGSEIGLVAFVLKKAEDFIAEQRLTADPPF